MELLFIISDVNGRYMEYQATGHLNNPHKRAVEIELTPEQVEKIGLKKIGVNSGMDVMETIESVSLKAE